MLFLCERKSYHCQGNILDKRRKIVYDVRDVKKNALTKEAGMDALEMTLLYDYYGELLTERQRMCFDLYHNQDLSLSEIAQELQVSRQGVYDNLNRAEAVLRNMEEKTGCVRRALQNRKAVGIISGAASQLMDNSDEQVKTLALSILDAARLLEE